MQEQAGTGFRLAPQQAHLWFVEQQGWNCNTVAIIQLDGPVQPAQVRQAVAQLCARHEVLRTVFRRMPGLKAPFQIVLPASEPAWENFAGGPLEELLAQERNRRFNLEQGPLMHAGLVSLHSNRSLLILTVPSVAGDSRSLQILADEIGTLLAGRASELPEVSLRYVRFAQWQRDLLESDDGDSSEGKDYWKKSHAAAPPIPVLPQELPVLPQENTASQAACSAAFSVAVESSLLQQLHAVADEHETALSDVLLAVWQSLIWRLTAQPQFRVTVSCDGREYEELRHAPGLIGKSLPIPAQFDGDLRFSDVLRQVHGTMVQATGCLEFYAPQESAAKEPSLAFDYAELAADRVYGGVTFRTLRQEACGERFKLKLAATESGDGLRLAFHFDSARLSRAIVERWSGYFLTMLAAAAGDPRTLVSRLPMLGEPERHAVLAGWNRTAADYPRQSCLQDLFEVQAAQTPDRPAVRCDTQVLTYRELNEEANRLAHALRGMGISPDSRVGLCVDRTSRMIVALMAVLKAGGAFVPLSADHPKSRLAQQLAGVTVLLTESKFLAQLPDFAGPVVCLDKDGERWTSQPIANPERLTNPENLAYVIYTSGSTGTPKGVAVRHRNLVNYACFIQHRLELERYPDGLHFATVSTLSADLGNTCIYPSLISGGCLHIIGHETAADSQRLRDYTASHPVDVLKIVPSHLAALLDAGGRDVLPRRYLIMGGEALTPQLVAKIAAAGAGCEIVNHYGPTETTVGSLTLRLKDYDWRNSTAQTIPIGRPIANTRVYILDAQREPVPVGVTGELYIAGDGVTAGYLDQPDRTAERFLADPFAPNAGGHMYRTGDLARYLPDGNVGFLGRADDQVKIRGFRIELGEIEASLLRHASVKQAVVLAREDQRGDKRLVAYVVGQRDSIDMGRLRAHLREELPEYMAPSAIVVLPKLPLNANGKIDRQALPLPEQVSAARAYAAPRTPTEAAVTAVWAEVLRHDRISVDDDFFEIGGHSLLATQIASRLREQFKVPVAVRMLFDHTTAGALSAAIDSIQQETDDEAEMEILPVSRR